MNEWCESSVLPGCSLGTSTGTAASGGGGGIDDGGGGGGGIVDASKL